MSNNENRIDSGEASDIECSFEILIQDVCARMEVAGSLRRGLLDVGDIEIVAEPMYTASGDNKLHERLERLLRIGTISLDRPRKDKKKNPFGQKYYRLNYNTRYDGEDKTYPVDLFVVTPPADFNVIYLIRTGSADFSHNFVSKGWAYGIHVKDGHLEKEGVEIRTTSERDVFAKMHVPYVEPENRVK